MGFQTGAGRLMPGSLMVFRQPEIRTCGRSKLHTWYFNTLSLAARLQSTHQQAGFGAICKTQASKLQSLLVLAGSAIC